MTIAAAAEDWVDLLLRWAHVMAGIGWIGTSFYFVALDLGLSTPTVAVEGLRGEAWQVHGGGFYRAQKYLVAPPGLPPELIWYRWEAFATWILGFCLLVSIYYLHPSTYLIDRSVLALGPGQAVAIGIGSLIAGWLVYDTLCRSPLGRDPRLLAVSGFVLLIGAIGFYLHVFGARAAFIHVGALVGTIMAGNVAMVIIPNQRRIVTALVAGETPDPRLGAIGKQRSMHNNYVTLPVVFVMLSSHYAFVYGGAWAWPTLAGIFVAGFLVRAAFNRHHAHAGPTWPLWLAVAGLVVLLASLPLATAWRRPDRAVDFAQVRAIIEARCQTCHALHPTFDGIDAAPAGIRLDGDAAILSHAREIEQQAVVSRAMPLNNATGITEDERAAIAGWIAAGAPGP